MVPVGVVASECQKKALRTALLTGLHLYHAVAECQPVHQRYATRLRVVSLKHRSVGDGSPGALHVGPFLAFSAKVGLIKFPAFGIGHFQITERGRSCPCSYSDTSLIGDSRAVGVKSRHDVVVRQILGKHLLHIVGSASEQLAGMLPYQIACPVRSMVVGNQRRIRGHLHYVGIALHVHHKHGFRKSRVHISGADTVVDGVLTYIDIKIATRNVVKYGAVVIEIIGIDIPVRINHVGL